MKESFKECPCCQGKGQTGEGGFYNAGEVPEVSISYNQLRDAKERLAYG